MVGLSQSSSDSVGTTNMKRLSYDVIRRESGESALVVHEGGDAQFMVNSITHSQVVEHHLVLHDHNGVCWVLPEPGAEVIASFAKEAAVRLFVLASSAHNHQPVCRGVFQVSLQESKQ